MAERDFIWRFTPGRTNPATLEKIFVQRGALLADYVERVRESALTPNKHYLLLVGPRGIGKTHMLALIRHRVTDNKSLHKRLRVAWLNEDESTTSFLDFLVRIYQALGAEYPDEFPADGLSVGLEHGIDEAVRRAQAVLLERLKKHTLLILVENADDLFKGLGDAGQKQLRAFLQEHPVTCIVATAQQLFKGVSKRSSPFFGFFQIDHLLPMDLGQAVELLTKIAEQHRDEPLKQFLQSPEGRGRVRALHHLAGGNHRVYVVLTQFIDRESLDQLIGPFEKMIDELTPYYQERLRWLAPQQRRIVETLCRQTAPIPVKELAKLLFVKEQGVASQLKKLKELGYVVSHTRGRESLYELTEPLMRLSFEVKENRREPLRLIVDFLRVWYRLEQLREYAGLVEGRTKEHVKAAMALLDAGDDPRMLVIQQAIDDAKAEGRLEEAILALEERAHSRGSRDDWFDLGYFLGQSGRHTEALDCFVKASAIEPDDFVAWNNRGVALQKLGRAQEAVESLDKALSLNPDYAHAWNNRGIVLQHRKLHQEALESYDKALAIQPDDAEVWNNRGGVFDNLERYQEALESYDRALAIQPDNFQAWGNRGVVLCMLGRHQEALESYDQALSIKPDYAHAAFNIIDTRFSLNQWTEGFAGLRMAFKIVSPKYVVYAGDVAAMIGWILNGGPNPEQWRQRIVQLVDIYAEAGQSSYLGDGLVRSLAKIDAKMLSQEALFAWRDIWKDVCGKHAELEVALRIFDVGIRYLASNDKKVLFDLIETERTILQQALKLDDER